MDRAEGEVAKRLANLDEESLPNIENQVFKELMYSDDDSHKRVVGYGFGVAQNQVFGLEGELLKRYNGTHNVTSEMQGIKSQLVSLEKKNAQSMAELPKENEKLRETNDVLQKQNAEIIGNWNFVIEKFSNNSSTGA